MTNRMYFGDCLEIMQGAIPDESVDLIYLDPPFNSKRIYNASMGGAQWVAFNDTWRWSEAGEDFHALGKDVAFAPVIEGLRRILGEGPELAYLSYMAHRLRECRRILKKTGAIYLHCDATMSHYLKIVMDGIFTRDGKGRFLNEIAWCYREARNARTRWNRKHDAIFFYAKGDTWTFNADEVLDSHSESTVKKYKYKDDKGYYRLMGRGIKDSPISSQRDVAPKWEKTHPELVYRHYLRKGSYPVDYWMIDIINQNSAERLGYPTQKPLALLERIIAASSHPGDVVFDPFCGCGTTIEAAQRLKRQWIGIDICVKACQVIEQRMRGHFDSMWDDVEFVGMPKTLEDAKTLAAMDKFKFERWAASLVDGMEANSKQRGDRGIDGRGRLAIKKGVFIDLVAQVKGGNTGPADVQAFNGARQQAGADLGIFTCFADKVTQAMRDAAAGAGRFMDIPAVQIYTIEDFFANRKPELPHGV